MWSQQQCSPVDSSFKKESPKCKHLAGRFEIWKSPFGHWTSLWNIAMEHRHVVWHFMGTTSIDITHIFHVKWPVVGVINSHLPAWPSTGRALRYQPATIEIMTGSHMCTQNAFIEASFMENLASCFSAMSAMVTGPERQHPSWWPSLQSDASNR